MKYCILAAGLGTRNNAMPGLHKALLPIAVLKVLVADVKFCKVNAP